MEDQMDQVKSRLHHYKNSICSNPEINGPKSFVQYSKISENSTIRKLTLDKVICEESFSPET